jgi:glycosyltransferase involved in cell wall biosynthesis
MKKIMLISPFPPPVGGIASWTVSIQEYFKFRGEIDIIYYNSKINGRGATNRNIIRRIIFGSLDVLFHIFKTFSIVLLKKPDVLHLNSSASLSLLKDFFLLYFLKNKRRKIVYHLHFGRIPDLQLKNNWEWNLLCYTLSKADLIIVLDEKSKNSLVLSGFNNILVLANPILLREQSNFINNRDFNKEGRVLFVGHIVKEKGIYELVEAINYINNLGELVLVGPCEDKVKEELLKIAGPKKSLINFLGVLDKEMVLDEMRKCSVFVLPSYSEGFPMVILEAMACSCAIIATKVGAIEDILADNSGVCINEKNVKELVESISNLLKNSELRKRLGNNAFNKVKTKYDIEIIGNEIFKIWDK